MRSGPRARSEGTAMRHVELVLLMATVTAACDDHPPPDGAVTRSCAAVDDAVRAQVLQWMAGPHVTRWDAWVTRTGFVPTRDQRRVLRHGGVLVGVAPTPVRHPNGMLEVEDAVFAEVEAG